MWKMLLAFCGLLLMSGSVFAEEGNYIATSDVQARASARKFLAEPPEDLSVKATYKGEKQLYGQIWYGSSSGTQLAFVVDQSGDSLEEYDLYVDADRDRVIREDEKVSGSGQVRILELDALFVEGDQFENLKREVRFRRSRDQKLFSVATRGGYQFECAIGGKKFPAVRIDGNGNGMFSDRDDEIWIDANGDGKWSKLAERHLCRPVIAIGGNRFAIRANERGSQLTFEPIVGEGTFAINADFGEDVEIRSFAAKVYGEDGSCHSVGTDKRIELPIGKYMLGQFGVSVENDDKSLWSCAFSHSGLRAQQKWFEVVKGSEVVVPLFGDLSLDFESPKVVQAGEEMELKPQLLTEHGLYITSCYKGMPDEFGQVESSKGQFELLDGSGRSVGNASSGFA